MKSLGKKRSLTPRETVENEESLFEDSAHAFIVKVWVEESLKEANRATWRGHITHAPTGRRCYLYDLGDILAFIIPYLERMGIKLDRSWQLVALLKGWRRNHAGTEGHE